MKAKDNNFLKDYLSFLLIPLFLICFISLKSFLAFTNAKTRNVPIKGSFLNNNIPFFEEKLQDINEASLPELIRLPGIGLKTAQAVIGFREKAGIIWDISSLLKPFGPLNDREFQVISCYYDVSFKE